MSIVSNTTPIISLLKINRQNILREIFKKIIIPQGVYDEIVAKSEFTKEMDSFHECKFIEIIAVKNEFAVRLLQKQVGLDRGESEAIVLAEDLKSKYLLIDERKGRKVAIDSELNVIGTLGVLVQAKKLGLEKLIKPLLDELINNNIRISNKLYEEVLKSVEEV